jgi:hypothetical protein
MRTRAIWLEPLQANVNGVLSERIVAGPAAAEQKRNQSTLGVFESLVRDTPDRVGRTGK